VKNAQTWPGKTTCLEKAVLMIDGSTHEVIAAFVSLAPVGDHEALPTLLNPLRRKIAEPKVSCFWLPVDCLVMRLGQQ